MLSNGKESKDAKKTRYENGISQFFLKSKYRIMIAAVVFILAAGFLLELFCNIPVLRTSLPERMYEVPLEQISYEGFVKKGDQLELEGESGTIHIALNGRYVEKLCYSYAYEGLLNMKIRAAVYNSYGELRERDALNVLDRNSKVLNRSYVKIGKRVDSIDLSVSRSDLFEPGLAYLDFHSYGLSLTGFQVLSRPSFNGYRLCFFFCLLGLVALLTIGKRYLGQRIEVGFLLISLSVGTLISLSLPANKVSWDEEIHFAQAFWLSNYRSPVHVSPAIANEFIAGVDTWPYNQPGTLEEQRDFNAYLDQAGNYKTGEILWSTDLNKTIFTGYTGMAVMLKIGQLFHIPFSFLFKLGRLGNLFVYCIVLYFAIKKIPVGKGIMAFLGMMPEPMMLAGVYSYDPTVTAFLYLSLAYIIWAILEPEQKLSWKEYGIICLSFFWGCRIKAVYAPLLLIGLLIPASHYRSKKERQLMRTGFLLMVAGLMASFVLPVLISPAETGDIRGNATSEAGQMAYVLGQPLSYAWILICNIVRTLSSYLFGEGALGTLGHQGTVAFPWLLYTGSVAVILTNGQSSCGKRLSGKQKLWISLFIGAAVVLIWTSMYLVFTTPGNTYIEGVQGRYYLPFLFLIWLVLNPKCLIIHLKNADYYRLVLGLGGGILLTSYYMNIFRMFCL